MHEHQYECQCERQCEYRLLRQYVEGGCQAAFGQLVSRYSGLVYSTCLRLLREPMLAEDAAQSVFLLLAQKAPCLPTGIILSGWLYRTACFVARDVRKKEARRRLREQQMTQEQMTQAGYQTQPPGDELWDSIAPLLDDALASLGVQDQTAVVLRFFEGRSLRETGTALGVSEAAAQMRVVRSLEKLRRFLARRGVVVAALLLVGLLETRAVQAAPTDCAASVLQTLMQHSPWNASLGLSHSLSRKGSRQSRQRSRKMSKIQWAATAAVVTVVCLTGGIVVAHSPTTASQSSKAAPVPKMAAKMSVGVYVCRVCRCYYTPTQAKQMGYAEPGSKHPLVYAAKPPAGYFSSAYSTAPNATHKG